MICRSLLCSRVNLPRGIRFQEINQSMNRNSFRSQDGVSLIEVLIVVVIAGILVTFSVTQFGRARENFKRQAIAREFKTSLERARFDSVKRHAADDSTMAEIRINSATSYTVSLDLNQNGTIESAESTTVDFSGLPGVRLLLPSGRTAPVSIMFDQRGHAIVSDYNDLSTDHFLFCDAGCTLANATSQNSSVIYVSATGTVAMLGGGDAMPSISDPTTSTVPSDSGINPDLNVYTGALPTPSATATPAGATPTPTTTPTPSVTPTPSPTATPTSPTPTPSPTPTATPAPTPTPLRSCNKLERPGNPATCSCNSPWFVAKNGKCGP